LAVAILGTVVTALGWLVTHILSTSAENRRQRLISEMEFTQQQLKELYGPIAFLVWEGRQSYQDLLSSLGLHQPLDEESIRSEEGLKTWLFWVENEFLPRDKKIEELLSKKTHLIEGETIPESFLSFLNYHNSWRVNHERWQKQGVEYRWLPKHQWPDQFDEEVLFGFAELKKRHSVLMDMLSESPSPRHYISRKLRQKKRIDQKQSSSFNLGENPNVTVKNN